MLSSISIKNFALLKDVSVEFSKGLNILTGETGAGKSIIIGALNIAVGERGYTENIRTGEDKSIIEAVFDISGSPKLNAVIKEILEGAGIEHDDGRIIIKREISRTNKGRIFINNSAASLNILQAAGKMLVDIHGQHEHQSLLKSEVHMELLDGYSRAEGLLEKVKGAHSALSAIDSELKKLKSAEAEKAEKLDMIDYRLNEMEQASFTDAGELERLNSDRDRLIHAEAIREHAAAAVTALSPGAIDLEGKGAIEYLNAVKKATEHIIKYDAKPQEAVKMVEEASIKAAEAKAYFLDYLSSLESDPAKLKQTEDRIELFEDLIKKYRKKNLEEVIEYYSELAEEKKTIEMNGEIIAQKEKERAETASAAAALCMELSGLRKKCALELSKKIEDELKDLGIGKAVFQIKLDYKEASEGQLFIGYKSKKYLFTPQGIDAAEFMISLNPGEDLKPLVKIASGGEVSRIMLAIKNILSDADITDVLVFDEIDTGISGKVAQTVGAKLLEISKKKQLVCITHLPQIAACSQKHFSVEKHVKDGKTETTIMPKTGQEKEIEVAKLLSGENVSDASLNAARELIKSIPAGR